MDANKLREDFPLYASEDKDIIYLDSACQTLRPRPVMQAMQEYYEAYPACGGRSVHRFATKVSIKVEEAREKVASLIGCPDPNCIIFTKNCTEAINLVAKGLSLRKGDAVLTTDMEHNSNHVPWLQLSKTMGLRHRFVKTPGTGLFDMTEYEKSLSREVRLVSMVHTNNVTGTTIPETEIIKRAHDHGSLVMLDGAQSAPHRPIDVEAMGVDMFALSAHKMLGPAGVGVLYAKMEVLEHLEPLISGGGSVGITDYDHVEFLPPPEKFEAGLLNYSGIIGTGAAADYLKAIGMNEIADHETRLNRLVTEGLKDLPELSILEPHNPTLRGGLFPFNIRGMGSHDVAMIIDEMAKVLIRSGMHCMHPFFLSRHIDGCARASFYIYNNEDECARFVDAVKAVASTFSS